MRQWNCDPKIMCRKHLLGEHVEHHMFLGTLKRKCSMDGYLNNNLLEPKSLKKRHKELADELLRRGYKHNSDLDFTEDVLDYLGDKKNKIIDRKLSKRELLRRCKECGK